MEVDGIQIPYEVETAGAEAIEAYVLAQRPAGDGEDELTTIAAAAADPLTTPRRSRAGTTRVSE